MKRTIIPCRVLAMAMICSPAAAEVFTGLAVDEIQAVRPLLTRENFHPRAEDESDLGLIRTRLYTEYLKLSDPQSPAVAEMLAALTPEGAWADIDYERVEPSQIPPTQVRLLTHLTRLAKMSAAFQDPGHPLHGRAELRDAIAHAFDYWLKKEPKAANGWYGVIGFPLNLLPTLALMPSELGRQRVEAGVAMVMADDLTGKPDRPFATGANLTWVARINIEAGAILGSAFIVERAKQRFEDEIRVTPTEGLQPDWSFTQHGRQLNTLGYGSSFSTDTLRVATLLEGTRFALLKDRLELMADFLINGQQWMVHNGEIVTGALGRGVSRNPGPFTPAGGYSAEQLALLLPNRAAELIEVGKRMRAAPDATPLIGNRSFYRVDVMAHHRPGWAAILRSASNRVIGAESGNGENLLCHHASDGVLETLINGQEYRRILPLWNWRRLPGTTILQTTSPLPLHPWGKDANGTTDFVGSVSDGTVGVAVLDHRRDHVVARKSWFFLPDRIIAVGTGIAADADAPDEAVYTTIEQCASKGRVVVASGDGTRELAVGDAVTAVGPLTVWHGPRDGSAQGTRYSIAAGLKVHVVHEHRTGSWHTINLNENTSSISADVFELTIDHGHQPAHAGYVYSVSPCVALRAPEAPEAKTEATDESHALTLGDDTSLIAFWKAGSFRGLQVDEPCLVIRSGRTVTLADPSGKLQTLSIRMPGPSGSVHRKIAMPTSFDAGRSVTIPIEAK